jgi:ATP-dependent protease ClpP protease subunit
LLLASWYRIEQNKADDESTVYLYGAIGGEGATAGEFVRELDAITSKTIKLRLNSPGGSVDDGIAIYNAIRSHPSTVVAYVDAAAHSIASVILQGANKRVMAPHSRMLVHNAMAMGGGFTVGYAEDFESLAAEAVKVAVRLRETTENIASIYSERTGKESAYWLAKMQAETRFSDRQAVDEGLADEVGQVYDAKNFKIAANFDWSQYREANEIREELAAVAGEPATVTSTWEEWSADCERKIEALRAELNEKIAELEGRVSKPAAGDFDVTKYLAGIRL